MPMQIIRNLIRFFILYLFIFSVDCLAQSSFNPVVKQPATRRQMPVSNVNEVIQDSEGYMWYATLEGGLCRDDGYHIDVFRCDMNHPDLLTDNLIFSLCEAQNGEIWFSTSKSVYALDKHDYSIRPLNDMFRNTRALHISMLPNGNMLLESDSVAYEVTSRHKIVKKKNVVYRGRFRIIHPDTEGKKWVCYDNRRLCYTESDTSRVIYQYNIKAKNILVDRTRNLLFAITADGLQVFNIDRGILSDCIYQYSENPELGVFGLYLDHQYNLWMTGYHPSFTVFTAFAGPAAKKLDIKSPDYSDVYVDRIQPLPDCRLKIYKDIHYVSLYDLNNDTEELVSNTTLAPKVRWDSNKKLAQLVESNVDIDKQLVKDAAIDDKGHLWIVFDQYVRELCIRTGHFRDISVSSCGMGMYNFHCVAAVENGVCVGGAGGACLFTTNERLNGAVEVPVCVSSYTVTTDDGTSTKGFLYSEEKQPSLELAANSSNVTLSFTTFNHMNATEVNFAVKINGWTEEWVNLKTGDNTFRIINLPKGNYEVQVRATDEYGIWGNPCSVLMIHRLPAWWETWWAYTLYIVLCIGLITGAFLLYRFVQQKREELYRSVITDDKHASAPYNAFREKAVGIVKKHIADDNYTVDMLAEALFMSRVNLYRKMLAECGQTPSDFIKTIRMEHAYHLLTTTDLSINIIAGKCGYTSGSYFAKCFKARYNILPTAVRKRN